MTSTVFGLRWLESLASVHQSLFAGSDASALNPLCVAANRSLSNIELPKYYSTLEGDGGAPWQYKPTVGRAYRSDGRIAEYHPIWFVRFSDQNGTSIARQPFSIASLLEVRAVASELLAARAMFVQASSQDFVLVEEQNFGRELLARLYTPELTVYSVAAHWFANHRELKDAATAYLGASHLAHFCLDAPTDWIRSISPLRTLPGGDVAQAAMRLSLIRADRGALFYMLAADSRIRAGRTVQKDLDALIKAEWGVSTTDLVTRAGAECAEALKNIDALKHRETMSAFIKAIEHNFGARTNGPPKLSQRDLLMLPAIILADDGMLDMWSMTLGEEACTQMGTFDPRHHVEEFWAVERAIKTRGGYSDVGDHCFADPF
jgi:hypothetical protein